MKVLGLDIATTSGYAVIEGDKIRAGKFTAKGETDDHLFADFRLWVRGLLAVEKPDFVAIEAPLVRGGREVADKKAAPDAFGQAVKKFVSNPITEAKLKALNAIAGMCCAEMGIPVDRVAVVTHRKAFLGAGKIPSGTGKDLTLAQCRQLGVDLKSKDAADAVSVAWWGAGKLRIERRVVGELFERA